MPQDALAPFSLPLPIEGLALRPLRLSDASDVTFHCNDQQLRDEIGGSFPYPYTLEMGEAFVAKHLNKPPPYFHLAITEHDRVVGSMSIVSDGAPHFLTAEIGYWVGRQVAGRGIATAATKAYVAYIFEAMPSYQRLEAFVYASNIASWRVLEKAGFEREGLLRRRGVRDNSVAVDDYIYALLKP